MAIYSPTILSLATGYGGLELGIELLFPGARTVCYVEREGYAAANLVARFQNKTMVEAPIWDDVTTFDGRPWRNKVDWVIGGYPCQPFSTAGKRRGTKDPRHLWPEFARIIREVSPKICFFENVANHINLGFREVAKDLQKMGFEVAATLVTAEEVGSPHKRERLFILATKLSDANRVDMRKQSKRYQSNSTERRNTQSFDIGEALADTNSNSGIRRRNPISKVNHNWQIDRTDSGEGVSGEFSIRGKELADAQGDDRGSEFKEKSSRLWRAGSPRVSEELANSDSQGFWPFGVLIPGNSDTSYRHDAHRCCRELGNTDDIHGGQAVVRKKESGRYYQPGFLFPPGRNDSEGWQALLERHADLIPAIESQIRQLPHGHPYWVDELRLNGNGVVPLQAAYALATLLADYESSVRNTSLPETSIPHLGL